MPKHKTTAELESERAKELNSKRYQQARGVLLNLMGCKQTLEQIGGKEARVCSTELAHRVDWLIAESEIYRDVAAELWRQEHTQGAASRGDDPCNQADKDNLYSY